GGIRRARIRLLRAEYSGGQRQALVQDVPLGAEFERAAFLRFEADGFVVEGEAGIAVNRGIERRAVAEVDAAVLGGLEDQGAAPAEHVVGAAERIRTGR